MGRPRNPDVEEVPGTCPVHGAVAFRRHKVGVRPNGTQKYRLRCLACHTARERERSKAT